jgi:excisionase family DNA binding protein
MTDIATSTSTDDLDLPEMLTTTRAAGVLGVTRRGLVNLIQSGALASVMVGTHQRFRTDDVIALRDRLAHAA